MVELKSFVKKEAVLCVAVILAAISMFLSDLMKNIYHI